MPAGASLAGAAPTAASPAGIYEPTWEPAIVVDTGATDISTSNGSAMERTLEWSPWNSRDEWHIVYAKGGEIYHAVLMPSGWQTPETLTNSGANARDPKLAFAKDRLILVWEDDRRGHPETWYRLWNRSSWGAEAGLADDATQSQVPVIAGSEDGAYVAWQEGSDGQTQIYGRFWDGYIWQAAAIVSVSPAYAIESTVSLRFPYADFAIAWADARMARPRSISGNGGTVSAQHGGSRT